MLESMAWDPKKHRIANACYLELGSVAVMNFGGASSKEHYHRTVMPASMAWDSKEHHIAMACYLESGSVAVMNFAGGPTSKEQQRHRTVMQGSVG